MELTAEVAPALVLDAAAARGLDEATIGGKAWGLARLEGAAGRVPPWCVVGAAAYRAHLAAPGVAAPLAAALGRLRGVAPDLPLIEAVAAEARTVIEAAPLEPALQAALTAALDRLAPGPFAVRSSAVGEDSGTQSFAGQLDSYLYQRGPDEVMAALRRCWGSSFTARALGYRLRGGAGLAPPRMAVVIQRMVTGETSGVLFTVDPVTGQDDHALLSACYGLCEGVVNGACDADEFSWDHRAGEVAARVATKEVQVIPAPDLGAGTVTAPIAAERQRERCLTPAQVEAICREGLRLAAALGGPQDMEWTLAGETLYLLQARPITTLASRTPVCAAVPESVGGPVIIWDNSNIQESYCGVTTPLTFSFAARAYASVFEQFVRALDVPADVVDAYQPVFRHLIGLVRGRVYYNINNWYRLLLILPGFGRNKTDMERMMGLDQPVDFVADQVLGLGEKLRCAPRLATTMLRLLLKFRDLGRDVAAFNASFEAAYRRVDRRRFARAPLGELMDLRELMHRDMLGNWHTPIVNDHYVMMANGRLRRLVETAVGPAEAPRILSQLMAGEEGIASMEPMRLLLRIAGLWRRDPRLRQMATDGTPADALARLRREGGQHAVLLEQYLEQYGDRCMGELKLETVSHREDPGFIMQMLRNYLASDDLDCDRVMAREQQQRRAAEAVLRARLGWLDRERCRRVLAAARQAIKHRESMRLTRTRGFGLYRDLHRAIGERLCEAGRLDGPRDVFYLTFEEIAGYHDGTGVSADLRRLARARRAEFQGYEQLELPHRFETRGPVNHAGAIATWPARAVDETQRVLTGRGCYPGVVEAEAKVIMSPRDDLSVNGKILVTLRTDPGWAPLFPSARGILVERGSTLSHSAILARELGIPAVVGVPDLLKIVRDGEPLRLDGARGIVERLAPRRA
ncbi:MAG TPA: phosphoenolpyruvate synthase [Polyangia bacterium]|jgi:pyruvate,water dikinase